MTVGLFCPECKATLRDENNLYFCAICKKSYPSFQGVPDFIGENDFYAGEMSRNDIRSLIAEIDHRGFEEALEQFLKKHEELRDYITNSTRSDWIYHCFNKQHGLCLDIGSGLGNISEILSQFYSIVYSLEAVKERIEFQIRRYRHTKRNNIWIVRGNALKLPFPDGFFDLVVCNGVLEWIGMMNKTIPPKEAQLQFLREVHRVLSDKGCLYIGIENRIGLPFLLGAIDHSGLRFTSVLPRILANLVVQKYGHSGGLYGDQSLEFDENSRGYYTYTYTIWGYRSLFKQAGFRTNPFWVFPSYNEPSISGNLNDTVGIKGFFRYCQNTSNRSRFLFSILEKFDKSLLSALVKLLVPSFLFFCYKNDIHESIDLSISAQTGLKSFTRLSMGNSVMYVLYNDKSIPSKVVRLDRMHHDPNVKLQFKDKTNASYASQESNGVWIEDWIDGRIINPLDKEEANKAFEWLIDFQSKNILPNTKRDSLLENIENTRRLVRTIPYFKTFPCELWIDEYLSGLGETSFPMTAEHGDFFYRNILFNKETKTVSVIDWENFREIGDPFFDFVFFIVTAMHLPGDSTLQFRDNLNGNGEFNHISKELVNIMSKHFDTKIDIYKLIPYTILRYAVSRYIKKGKYDKTFEHYLELLTIFSSNLSRNDL